MLVARIRSEPLLVSSFTGEQEDTCSIYPLCSEELGPGSHEILEDCQRFFRCERLADGKFKQSNLMCEGNTVFTNKLGRCGDPEEAPECAKFNDLKCKLECLRIHFTSSGLSATEHPDALKCFRLKGSKDINRAAYYENPHHLTLTPYPTNIWVSWHVTANIKCPYSGILVNEQDKYLSCPHSDWKGWEIKTGGRLVRDKDIVTTCLSGDEEITLSTTTTATTTATTATTITSSTTTTTSTTTTSTSTSTTNMDEILKGK